MQDFDKKLTETDSYLQILIDQVKVNITLPVYLFSPSLSVIMNRPWKFELEKEMMNKRKWDYVQ